MQTVFTLCLFYCLKQLIMRLTTKAECENQLGCGIHSKYNTEEIIKKMTFCSLTHALCLHELISLFYTNLNMYDSVMWSIKNKNTRHSSDNTKKVAYNFTSCGILSHPVLHELLCS